MHSRRSSRDQVSSMNRLRQFFFAEEVPFGLAIMRIILPMILFVDLSKRWIWARELYSADGATTPIWIGYGLRSPLPELPGAVTVALFTLLLVALLASSAGWMTRISLAISTVLYWYFTSLDSLSTISKYTVIATHLLLLLTVSNCGAVWSLDSLRRAIPGPRFPVWPRRLMQLLIGVVYFGAAMTKVHTPAYFNGDQMMWWMLTHVLGKHPAGEYLANFPPLLVIGAYAAIVWEVLFLFLAWRGWSRIVLLVMGVGFHVSTYITLGIDIFPCVMITSYFSFLGERDTYFLRGYFQRIFSSVNFHFRDWESAATWFAAPARRLGPIAFITFLWTAALGGAAIERVADPYRARTAAGPLELPEMDPELARKMLARMESIRPEDQIFALELGSSTFGDAVIGRKTMFEPGETLIAQVIAAPPHGDAFIECNLHSADGHIVERRGKVLQRETNRLNFNYDFCDASQPGDYEIVLKLAGTEVARRKFTLLDSGNHATKPPQQIASPVAFAD